MSVFQLIPIANAAAANDATAAFGKILSPVVDYIVTPLISLAIIVAFLVFVWGALQLIIHGTDDKAREKGKQSIMYGLAGIMIMLSAWGIIYLIANTVRGFQ